MERNMIAQVGALGIVQADCDEPGKGRCGYRTALKGQDMGAQGIALGTVRANHDKP